MIKNWSWTFQKYIHIIKIPETKFNIYVIYGNELSTDGNYQAITLFLPW